MGKPIVIADDHPLFRAALRQAVAIAAPDRDLVETDSLAGAFEALQGAGAGLLCLDLHMSDSDGFAGLVSLKQAHPALPVVVVSGCEDRGIYSRAVNLGAAGFVPKSSDIDTICDAITTVLDGEVWLPDGLEDDDVDGNPTSKDAAVAARIASLTPTQLKVLLYVKEGLLNKQIAFEMDVSEATVKAHMTAIMRKLKVQTRTQAVLAASILETEPDSSSGDQISLTR
ncbi:MAG: response regulator transcription factor [Pseudomonadota bacterium]